MGQSATRTDQPAIPRRRGALALLALVLALGTLAVLPAGALAFISAGDGGWIQQSSGTDWWLNSVSFTDASHGWAVGDHGTILATASAPR